MLNYPTRYEAHRTGYHFLQWNPHQKLYHPGIDFNYGTGSDDKYQEVICPTWARCLYVSPRAHNGGLGLYIVLLHPHNGPAATRYMHLDSCRIHAGETIYPRQIIGLLGSTGVTADHLHFEVLNEKGLEFINRGSRPYGGYSKGLTQKQILSYWKDPTVWLETEEHYVGADIQKKINQAQNALKWAAPPRKYMIERLLGRLQRLI